MRSVFFCLISVLIGLSIGLMVNYQVIGDSMFKPTSAPLEVRDDLSISTINVNPTQKSNGSQAKAEDLSFDQRRLLSIAYNTLEALKAEDFAALSTLVHPQKGLSFTPFSTVDPSKDRNVSAAALAKASGDSTLHIWGLYDGSGMPIQMTTKDYLRRFVYNADYIAAPMIGVNHLYSSGNSAENVALAYPEADFAEFYFPGLDPKNNGFDWCALKLVFELVGEDYKLVGLIHSEWTI